MLKIPQPQGPCKSDLLKLEGERGEPRALPTPTLNLAQSNKQEQHNDGQECR